MKKASFTFPSYTSLWMFKDKTKAIHIRVEPKKQVMSGLFKPEEIDMAVKQYQAVLHGVVS
jgi:hypothetical protein